MWIVSQKMIRDHHYLIFFILWLDLYEESHLHPGAVD